MATNRNAMVERKATEVLAAANVRHAPVPVERVARHLGLDLTAAELGDDVSGVLVVNEGHGTIGYNSEQAPVRQRFTIAHECGHWVLHNARKNLFIDKQYSAVFKRDQSSATGERLLEIQANQFAAALLMPESMVLEEVKNCHFDLGDEIGLRELADKFEVSVQAMSLRLSNLGVL